MKEIVVKIEGIRTMIIHNGRLADPLNPWSKRMKELSSKTKKTDQDHERMAEVEWEAGLYWDDTIGLHMPSENLQRMFIDACKKRKLGRQSIGIIVDHDIGVPIISEGHKDIEAMRRNPENRFRKAVKVGASKVMRTRPCVPAGWTMTIRVMLDESLITSDDFIDICHIAGKLIGVGDWRPASPKVAGQFGRFVVTHINGKPADDPHAMVETSKRKRVVSK